MDLELSDHRYRGLTGLFVRKERSTGGFSLISLGNCSFTGVGESDVNTT